MFFFLQNCNFTQHDDDEAKRNPLSKLTCHAGLLANWRGEQRQAFDQRVCAAYTQEQGKKSYHLKNDRIL